MAFSNNEVCVQLAKVILSSNRTSWWPTIYEVTPVNQLVVQLEKHGLYPRDVPPPVVSKADLKHLLCMDVSELQAQWFLFWICFGTWGRHPVYNREEYHIRRSVDGSFYWRDTIHNGLMTEWDIHWSGYHGI